MFKKVMLAIAVAGGLASMPAASAAGENPGCMLTSGCFWTDIPTDAGGGYWTCPDPQTYMLCRED